MKQNYYTSWISDAQSELENEVGGDSIYNGNNQRWNIKENVLEICKIYEYNFKAFLKGTKTCTKGTAYQVCTEQASAS